MIARLIFLQVKDYCVLAQEAWKNTALGCELSKCLVADKGREYNHLLEEQRPPCLSNFPKSTFFQEGRPLFLVPWGLGSPDKLY